MDESRLETRNRIFICLSSKDRQLIVESIMYHIANYGFAIWYDRHKMLLGDKRNVTILFSATTILSAVFQPIK